jgi:hypothetical protein
MADKPSFADAAARIRQFIAADAPPPLTGIIGPDGEDWDFDAMADGFAAALADGFGESDAASIMAYAHIAADMASYADRLCDLATDFAMNAAVDIADGMPADDAPRRYAQFAAHAAAIAPRLDAAMTDISHAIGLIAMDGIRLRDDRELPAMRAALAAMASGYECVCAAERLRDECRDDFSYYVGHASIPYWRAYRDMDTRANGAIAGCAMHATRAEYWAGIGGAAIADCPPFGMIAGCRAVSGPCRDARYPGLDAYAFAAAIAIN